MPYSYPEIRSFAGLYLQQNSFQVPDGAMEIASRIVLRSDEVLTKTNGLFEYWRPDGISPLDTLNATYTYQGVLIGFFTEGVGYFTDSFPYGGTFNSVGVLTANPSGDYAFSVDPSVSFMQQNSNLYFTGTTGVLKIESYSDKVRRSGTPPGLGIRNSLGYDGEGVLLAGTAGSQTAYRAVFGRRDTNGNLLLSAPSDVITVGVPAPITSLAYTVASGVCTFVFIDENLVALGDSFEVSAATNPVLDGLQINTSPTLDGVITFSTGAANGSGTLTLTLAVNPLLTVDIPSEITDLDDEYFVQIYRTASSASVTATPFPTFKQVLEITITQDDIDAGVMVINDTVNDTLAGTGAELYTNPNTREGELQINSRPPLAKYIDLYKSYAAYANITSVQRMIIDLVNSAELVGINLLFKSGSTTEVYKAVSTSNYAPYNVYPVNATAAVLTINYGTHSFPIGSIIRLSNITGTVVPGDYAVTAVGATTMTISTTGTMTAVTVQVISDGTAFLYNGYNSTDQYGILNILPIAQWSELVARDLCRVINANRTSFMYANYVSAFDDFPGKIAIQSKNYIDPIYLAYSAEPTNPAFVQNIPSSFATGIQFFSDNDVQPNWVYFSKVSEPDSVPIINFFPVGSANSPILGIHALKDSLIVLKADGIYKIVGDVIDQFVVTAIDTTVKLIDGMTKPSSTINNTVIAFCNQGVIQISENSVQVISRRIEDVIQPLIGRDLSATYLAGHESERLFYVQTIGLNPGDAMVTWIYNVLNQTWTSTPDVFSQLGLGPDNALFGVREDSTLNKNVLWRQRKTNTRVDWCNEYLIGDLVVEPVLMISGTFTPTAGNDVIPAIGDVILAQNIFNRIIDVTPSGGDYILEFAQMTSIPTGSPQTVTLYKGYETKIKMAPFHAGQVGRSKHFAQMQIHLRQQVLTSLIIDFAGAYFGGSEVTDWQSLNVSTAGASGWGFSPWGLFPWGLVDGANLVAGTEPANIIRVYIPRFAARNTFIQAILSHRDAAQPMLIQSLGFSVHGYGERTSR